MSLAARLRLAAAAVAAASRGAGAPIGGWIGGAAPAGLAASAWLARRGWASAPPPREPAAAADAAAAAAPLTTLASLGIPEHEIEEGVGSARRRVLRELHALPETARAAACSRSRF
jgi:hypothetical protein